MINHELNFAGFGGRLSNRRKITAEFEIVTPMFLGGADHEATRIRETSIKGALAFWWRALNYARFVKEAAKPDSGKPKERRGKSALALMQMDEQKLFGGPKGQGVFLLRVTEQPKNTLNIEQRMGADGNHCTDALPQQNRNQALAQWEAWEKKLVGPGARYFGYGLMGAAARKSALLDRSCLKAEQTFSVQILFRQSNQDEVVNEIVPALKLFGLLGGLGSRVRRGWGSVSLTSLTAKSIDGFGKWQAIKSVEEYRRRLNSVIGTLPTESGTDWRLTAFAKESRIWVSDKECSTGLESLDQLGRALVNYRAWGQNGYVGDQVVQKQFEADHNWFYNIDTKVDIPHRVAFGLPQNYFKYDRNGNHLRGSVNQGKEGRRGSPMFFHVSKIDSRYIGVVSLFPTLFISGNVQARNSARQTYDDTYSLTDSNGSKNTTGLEVLQGFVGHGTGTYKANQVLTFEKVYP